MYVCQNTLLQLETNVGLPVLFDNFVRFPLIRHSMSPVRIKQTSILLLFDFASGEEVKLDRGNSIKGK